MAAILARRWMKPLARLMVGLLLFAQLAVSAQACTLAQPSATHAFTQEAPCPDCVEMSSGQNLCLVSYLQDSQASRAFDGCFCSAAIPVSFTTVLSPLPLAALAPSAPLVRAHSSDPPLQILYCSYQT
jgi:hypothetical protein